MSCAPFFFMLILMYLSLFTDFCRIFAPYLERGLILGHLKKRVDYA